MTSKIKKLSKKAIVIVLLLILAAILIGGCVYIFTLKSDKKNNTSVNLPTETINYDPATAQERDETEAHKNDVNRQIEIESNSSTPSDQQKTVQPTITYANQDGFQVEVDSFISGVVEDGGTCKLILSKDQKTIQRTSGASKDATTTVCAPFILQSTELSQGTWSAIVEYSSTTSKGKSEVKTFNVR